jgi:hypothetical protein
MGLILLDATAIVDFLDADDVLHRSPVAGRYAENTQAKMMVQTRDPEPLA